MFFEKLMPRYDEYFPPKGNERERQNMQSPWKTSAIKKSPKHKKRLHKKLLKTVTQKWEWI